MRIENEGATLRVWGLKELAANNANEFRKQVLAACSDEVRSIELEMSSVEFVDSIGLGALIALGRTCRSRNGRLRLVNPSRHADHILKLTRLGHVFEIVCGRVPELQEKETVVRKPGGARFGRFSRPADGATDKLRLGAPRRTFRLNAPDAGRVLLAGDFTGWQASAIPMNQEQHGEWEVSVNLVPGTYGYRFIVDEKWVDDPVCSAYMPNAYGTRNAVVCVP